MRSYHPLFFSNGTIAAFDGSDVQAALRQRRDSEVSRFARIFGIAAAAPEGSVEPAAVRELDVRIINILDVCTSTYLRSRITVKIALAFLPACSPASCT